MRAARAIKASIHEHLAFIGAPSFADTVRLGGERLDLGGLIGLVNFGDQRYEDFYNSKDRDVKDFGNAFYIPGQNLLFVKGQEVPTKEGHVLVLGLKKGVHLKQYRPLRDTINESNDHNATLVVDHPNSPHGGLVPYLAENPELVSEFQGWEIHNGNASLFPGANSKAREDYNLLRQYHKIGAVSVTDSHSLPELGRSYTLLTMPLHSGLKDADDVSSSLRNAVQSSRPDDCVMKDAIIPAAKHALDIAILTGLTKLGLRK